MTNRIKNTEVYPWPQFLDTGLGNEILQIDPVQFVSYSPYPLFGHMETALMIGTEYRITGGSGTYLILQGDWRDEYRRAAHEGGAALALELYLAKREERSSWSEDFIFEEDRLMTDDEIRNLLMK